MRRLKMFLSLLAVGVVATNSVANASDDKRIKVYPNLTKGEIVEKIEANEWAQGLLKQAYGEVDKYVGIHQGDTTWIISRMQMYWKNHYTTPYVNGAEYSRAEGEAPVPTVRYTGGRNWASNYSSPSLENIKPYMDYNDDQMYLQNRANNNAWEWVDNGKTAHIIENINVSIMNKAMYSAFIYWLTGEQKYAEFAYDILKFFTDGMYYRKPPITEINHGNKNVVGLTSFEVIHEGVVTPMTLCYNFLYDYLKEQDADIDRMHTVFQNFAEQIILNGVPHNNWNVFQARFITYIALSLDDDACYENGRGKQYYIDFILNQNADRQRALTLVRDIYDPYTAMWNESPGYSTSTTKDLLEVLLLIDGMESGDILKNFEIVERAAYASLEYELPNMRTTAFGDNGYQVIDNLMYETLLAYYTKYGQSDKIAEVSAIINAKSEAGLYDRNRGTSLFKLFNYVDNIDPKAKSDNAYHSAMFYAPNINLTILRNGVDKESGLMLVNAGTGFNHNNNNGINLELYGKGYALAVDKGRGGSYWVDNHRDYYNAPISHNTVIVDGVSTNNGPEMKAGIESRHTAHSAYPAANEVDAAAAPVVSYVDNEFDERSTKSAQRRFNSIIRTSDDSGYYVDIFRSAKRDGGDKMHEYIYHNVGQSLKFYGADNAELSMKSSSDLTSKGGRAKGYDYITEEQSLSYEGDFRATFSLDMSGRDNVSMDMWMAGESDRKLYSVITPRALKGYDNTLSKELEAMEVPAVIVRQSGEAWSAPFVAIYEPYITEEGASIESVKFLDVEGDDAVAVEVLSKDGSSQLILNTTSKSGCTTTSQSSVKGIYGVVSTKSEAPIYMFMAEASELVWGDIAIVAQEPITALIEWCECGSLRIDADGDFTLEMPRKSSSVINYINCKGEKISVEGSVVKTSRGKRMVFKL